MTKESLEIAMIEIEKNIGKDSCDNEKNTRKLETYRIELAKRETTSSIQQDNSKVIKTASKGKSGSLTDPIDDPYSYSPGTNWESNSGKLIDIGKSLIGAIRILGTIVAVVTLMVIGIKYMFGGIEEKASYKERMIPYIIGAVLLFTIPTLLDILYKLVTGLNY